MALSVSVVLIALSTLNSSILQSIGKLHTPIFNALIALGFQTVLLIILLKYTNLDVFAVAICYAVYAGIMALLNQRAVSRAIGYKQELINTFVKPFECSFVMCLHAYGVYRLVLLAVHDERTAVVPAILVAVPLYFILLVVLKAVNERELKALPGGTRVWWMLKKVHLIK